MFYIVYIYKSKKKLYLAFVNGLQSEKIKINAKAKHEKKQKHHNDYSVARRCSGWNGCRRQV